MPKPAAAYLSNITNVHLILEIQCTPRAPTCHSYTGHHSTTSKVFIISPFHHRTCSLPRTERRISDAQGACSFTHPPHPAPCHLLLRLDAQHELLDRSVL